MLAIAFQQGVQGANGAHSCRLPPPPFGTVLKGALVIRGRWTNGGLAVSFCCFGVYAHMPYYVIPSEAIEPSRVYLANGNQAVCAVCICQTCFMKMLLLFRENFVRTYRRRGSLASAEIRSTRLCGLARDDTNDVKRKHIKQPLRGFKLPRKSKFAQVFRPQQYPLSKRFWGFQGALLSKGPLAS